MSEDVSETNQKDPQAVALEWKERGNGHYGNHQYAKAAKAYQSGLDALEQDSSKDSELLAVALRSNLAMVLLRVEAFEQAEQECSRILQIDSENTKGKKLCRRFWFCLPFS